MANERINQIPTTATSFASDDYLPIDGTTNGTRKILGSPILLKDSNNNITVNNVFEGFSTITASGTTVTLTIASPENFVINGSGGQVIKLPDATTLSNGTDFIFNNNQSSGTVTVQNNSGTTVCTLQSGSFITVILLTNSTAAGTWDYHNSAPSNASWSTNTLNWAGAANFQTLSTTGNAVLATSSGNVGIGTNSPACILNPYFTTTGSSVPSSGTSDPALGFRIASGVVGFDMGILTSGTAYIQNRNVNGFVTSYNLLLNPNGGSVVVGTPTITSGGGPLQLGGGITFPATQVNSSNVNTLDDYKEGTCQINISDGTNTVNGGTSYYTKVGRLVTLFINNYAINVSTLSTTAQLFLTNLPYVITQPSGASLMSPYPSTPLIFMYGASGTSLTLEIPQNGTDFTLFTRTSYGLASVMSLFGTITYFAAT